jgi:hypothetical protein
MKIVILFTSLFIFNTSKAQSIESIHLNLYTDSLKKGTYNYINVDGQLSNGRYLPLDSTHIIFHSSDGYFSGNSLWIEPGFPGRKITVTVTLRANPATTKTMDIWIKQLPDGPLKTSDQLMKEMRQQPKRKSNS